MHMLGWQDSAAQLARGEVGGMFEAMKASPLMALDDLFKALPWYCLFSYYAGPLLLLVGVIAQSAKPKSFKTFGSK